jgi:hypothetical protein
MVDILVTDSMRRKVKWVVHCKREHKELDDWCIICCNKTCKGENHAVTAVFQKILEKPEFRTEVC